MRILRLTALLVFAVAAFAADRPNDGGQKFPPQFDWKTPGGSFQLSTPFESSAASDVSGSRPADTCYFIRSYVMKREDDTGATHLDHVTTCTPSSRFQSKKAKVRVVPALAR